MKEVAPKKEVKVKWVKAARQWCRTTITVNAKGEKEFKQEWFDEKP